jgi:hypothetical protein
MEVFGSVGRQLRDKWQPAMFFVRSCDSLLAYQEVAVSKRSDTNQNKLAMSAEGYVNCRVAGCARLATEAPRRPSKNPCQRRAQERA